MWKGILSVEMDSITEANITRVYFLDMYRFIIVIGELFLK
jgi:hypothetical protein